MSFDRIGHNNGHNTFDRIGHNFVFTKLSFIVFVVKYFFLCYFLVVKNHELSQSTGYLVSVSLILEYVRNILWSVFFSINFLPDDELCNIAI